MADYYNRYEKFRTDGQVWSKVPFIKIKPSGSDLYITFNKGKMRFDSLSYKYYGDPNYGWLILQANPGLGAYEFNINDNTTIRIPYPLDDAINRYESAANQWINEHNIDELE